MFNFFRLIMMQAIQQLLDIMCALRDPESGCPWDITQDFQSLIPYTIEEAYEVADAIERNDINDIKSELGDLLFQVVFYSQLANEKNEFDFNDVVQGINEKITRRHPHVFADEKVNDVAEQTKEWERIKQKERETKAKNNISNLSILDGVSRTIAIVNACREIAKACGEGRI